MVFNVKTNCVWRNARLVVDGHMTASNSAITYTSVMLHETLVIALMIATLNDWQFKESNMMNY